MQQEVHPLILRRRSLRAIDPHRPVPQDVVTRLLEAARWAPSSGNSQPWRFYVINSPEALAKAHTALHPGNQRWANRAPLMLLICANPADDGDINGQPLYLLDCGLAVENLLLQGTEEGLVVHPIAGWDEAAMRAVMEIPHPYRIVVVIVIGYPGPLDELPEDLQIREQAPRERKPLSELTHYNRW